MQSSTPESRSSPVCPLPSSLAATVGISFDFSSSGYLDVSVPRVPFLSDTCPWRQVGFPIRTSTDQYLLAVPRSFSQLTASFIGWWRLGIRRMPLVAWLFQLTKNFAFLDLVNSFSLLSHWLEVPCHLINNKDFLFFCLKFSRYNRRFLNLQN